MRVVSQRWGALNAALSKERRFFFRIITTPGNTANDVYICSHDDVPIDDPGTVLIARPKSHPKIRTQQLNIDEGRATIGSMTFDAIDVSSSITNKMRSELLTSNRGWRGKKVQYFSGFKRLEEQDDYELEDTQLISSCSYSAGVYSFKCSDVQREARKNIFEPIVMRLAQPLDATATTIEVFTSAPGGRQLTTVEHGTSYSDAPSATVAYVKIDDEIIRVPTAGIGSTQLTSCVRGRLGTRAAEHTTDENASSSRGKEVAEVFYLELPVPKLVYSLLTGVLIQQSGTLPSHWHLGITAGTFVRLGDFTGLGLDLYDQFDDTVGAIERYILTDSEDGKTFLEKEVLRKYGLFMPVHADGSLGLRRGQPVLSGSAVVGEINDSHLVEDLSVTWDMTKIINDISIAWNEVAGEPTRFLDVVDTDSVTKWGKAPQLSIVARGLVGSRLTDSRVRGITEFTRDRYSGPPILTEATVHSSQSLYEVGDVIRLNTSRIRDFTNATTTKLDRAMEIQGITKNLANGTISYSLFGSSQKAGPLPPLETTAALPDGFYNQEGTNIAGMSGVTDAGAELQLPDGLEFTGASTVDGAIYYALKDVRIPSGNTVSYTNNVQLRIRGVLQIDGDLSGEESGLAGVADTLDHGDLEDDLGFFVGNGVPVDSATQPGALGYFGVTQADGGLIERMRETESDPNTVRVEIQSLPATITRGAVEAIPSLHVEYDGTDILGVPNDLRGCSGGPGGFRYYSESRNANLVEINRGGQGGAGGAGMLVISRGFVFGASGRVVTSGGDGQPGVINLSNDRPAWSGGGAGGAPGALLILLDGASSPSPVLTNGTVIADYGVTPDPTGEFHPMQSEMFFSMATKIGTDQPVPARRFTAIRSATSGRQAGIAAARFFFLLPQVAPEADPTDESIAAQQDFDLDVEEAYAERLDPEITLIKVSVTEVDVTDSFSHVNVYAQRVSGPSPDPVPVFKGPADPEVAFELPADGETYVILGRAVLINGFESFDQVDTEAIVTDSNQLPPTPNDLIVQALSNGIAITVIVPNNDEGTPTEVEIWRATDPDTKFADAVKRRTVPVTYSIDDNDFKAFYTDGGVGDTTYYYFALATNRHGSSTDHYPNGTADGVEVTPAAPGTGAEGPPGTDAIYATVSYVNTAGTAARPNIWRQANNGGAWTPTDTAIDALISFFRGASSIATQHLRATLNTSTGAITLTQQSAPTGETTSRDDQGSTTGSVASLITHNASGVKVLVSFVAVRGGDQGSAGSPGAPGTDGTTSGIEYTQQNVWRQEKNQGAWTPSGTQNDGTVRFHRTGSEVASRTFRATLTTATGLIAVALQGSPTGETTTHSIIGSGTGSVTVLVTHTASGARNVLTFVAIRGGDQGNTGPQGPDGALRQMIAVRGWDFTNSLDGWAAVNATLAPGPYYMTVDSTAGDPQIYSTAVDVRGATDFIVRARIMRIGGAGWEGVCFYSVSGGHGVDGSFFKQIADPTVLNQWVIAEWDMSALTAGGDDWVTRVITSIRLDLGASSNDDFRVDWVKIGRIGVGDPGVNGIEAFAAAGVQMGAFGSVTFTPNSPSPGSIATAAGTLFYPGGVSQAFTAVSFATAYQGSTRIADVFYLLAHRTSSADGRFGAGFTGSGVYYCAEYDPGSRQWRAIGSGGQVVPYTLDTVNETILAVGSRPSTLSPGIATLAPFIVNVSFNTTTAAVFFQAASIGSALIQSLIADKIATGNLLVALNLTAGEIQVSSTGKIYGGKSTFASVNPGFFLGMDAGVHKFNIGDANRYMRWNGAALEVGGDVIATGNLQSAAAVRAAGQEISSIIGITNPMGFVQLNSVLVSPGAATPADSLLYVTASFEVTLNNNSFEHYIVQLWKDGVVHTSQRVDRYDGSYPVQGGSMYSWLVAAPAAASVYEIRFLKSLNNGSTFSVGNRVMQAMLFKRSQ